MSRTPVRGWPVAAWQSIVPPRVINLLQVAVYGAVLVSAALILASPGSTPGEVVLGCVAMVVGPALGIPSAWRGWCGMECSAAPMIYAAATQGDPAAATGAVTRVMALPAVETWLETWLPGLAAAPVDGVTVDGDGAS